MHIEAFCTIVEETKTGMASDQIIRPDFGPELLTIDISNDIAIAKIERRRWVGLDRFIFLRQLEQSSEALVGGKHLFHARLSPLASARTRLT